MSINDATNVASATAASSASSVKKITKSLANNILAKTLHQLRRKCYKTYFAKSFDQLPIDTICELNAEIIAHYSGPDAGISDVSLVPLRKPKSHPPPVPSAALSSHPTVTTTTIAESDQEISSSNTENVKIVQESTQNGAKNSLSNSQEVNETNVTGNSSNNRSERASITEKTLITECLDSFFKSGITKWNVYHHRAYGIACSLYENNPVTKSTVGEPIADVYAVLTRRNSSILLLADGVNWGPRSRLAARCAVRASMNYINRNLFFSNQNTNLNASANYGNNYNSNKYTTTHDIFKIMCRSFDAAQEFILQKKGTMTTLCCCVVVKLKDSSSSSSSSSSNSLWAVCTLSIGDSTAYVFNRSKGVFELTYGARNLNDDRDMRNVGGALGHVYGIKPDVSNLNYSLTYIRENDIVFLVSDGVSDNLDPIVSQTARKQQSINENEIPNEILANSTFVQVAAKQCGLNRSLSQSYRKKSPSKESLNLKSNVDCNNKSSSISSNTSANSNKTNESKEIPLNQLSADDQHINLSSLPVMSPYERYVCSLAHMNEILSRNKTPNDTVSAQETCAILIEHVLKLTANKREMLEKGLMEAASLTNDEERIKFQATLRAKVQKLRGKLDHASICAYEVGTSF